MRPFSQRKGLKPAKTKIQMDDIDKDLRNSLWNALDEVYWSEPKQHSDPFLEEFPKLAILFKRMWIKRINN